jgi:hypothetical protein
MLKDKIKLANLTKNKKSILLHVLRGIILKKYKQKV